MERAGEYDRKAEEMEREAQRQPLGSVRDEYLKLAEHWRKLASARRAMKR